MAKGSNVRTFQSCAPPQTPAESSCSLNKVCSETPDSETQASEISSFPALFLRFPAFGVWLAMQFSTAKAERGTRRQIMLTAGDITFMEAAGQRGPKQYCML